MVDPQTVHEPLVNEAEHERVRRFEDLGVLDPQPGELVDVEEPAVPAGGVEVEVPSTQLRVAPELVLLLACGEVIRHDVEHDTESGRAQLAKRLFAAQLVRDAPRVDAVVAVSRPVPGLQHRREIQVTHPEPGEVRHECPGLREGEVGAELEPVRGAQLHSVDGFAVQRSDGRSRRSARRRHDVPAAPARPRRPRVSTFRGSSARRAIRSA